MQRMRSVTRKRGVEKIAEKAEDEEISLQNESGSCAYYNENEYKVEVHVSAVSGIQVFNSITALELNERLSKDVLSLSDIIDLLMDVPE
ncbi:hypothetical protein TNCV_2566191 [Trichonephila clavipes]|nr:hypothetical protein TNCV_2566191 [Trichonephila clavipes]